MRRNAAALRSRWGLPIAWTSLARCRSPGSRRKLSAAALFATCSLQENAPLSISEAMAAGVPVLATAVGGIPWMVTDGVTGRLMQAGDASGAAKRIVEMLTLDDLERMSVAARQRAEHCYRASEVARQTVAVYEELASRRRAGR